MNPNNQGGSLFFSSIENDFLSRRTPFPSDMGYKHLNIIWPGFLSDFGLKTTGYLLPYSPCHNLFDLNQQYLIESNLKLRGSVLVSGIEPFPCKVFFWKRTYRNWTFFKCCFTREKWQFELFWVSEETPFPNILNRHTFLFFLRIIYSYRRWPCWLRGSPVLVQLLDLNLVVVHSFRIFETSGLEPFFVRENHLF